MISGCGDAWQWIGGNSLGRRLAESGISGIWLLLNTGVVVMQMLQLKVTVGTNQMFHVTWSPVAFRSREYNG